MKNSMKIWFLALLLIAGWSGNVLAAESKTGVKPAEKTEKKPPAAAPTTTMKEGEVTKCDAPTHWCFFDGTEIVPLSAEDALTYEKEIAQASASSTRVIKEKDPVPVCRANQRLIQPDPGNPRGWYCDVICESPSYKMGSGLSAYCEVLNCPDDTVKEGEGPSAVCKNKKDGAAKSGTKTVTAKSSPPVLRQRGGAAGQKPNHLMIEVKEAVNLYVNGGGDAAKRVVDQLAHTQLCLGWMYTPTDSNWNFALCAQMDFGSVISWGNVFPKLGVMAALGYQILPRVGVELTGSGLGRFPATADIGHGDKVDLGGAAEVNLGLNLTANVVGPLQVIAGAQWAIPVGEPELYRPGWAGSIRVGLGLRYLLF